MIVTFVLLTIMIINPTNSANMLTKYKIEIENFLPCPDNDKLESPLRNIVMKNTNNGKKKLSYDVEFKRPLDKNVGGYGSLERWGNAGWVTLPFMPFYPDVCNTMMKFFKNTWVSYNKALGVKQPDKCPVPAGKYHVQDYDIDLGDVTVPTWGGKYRMKQMFQLVDSRKTIYCSQHLVNIKEIV